MKLYFQVPICAVVMSLVTAACAPVEEPGVDEDVPAARPAQLIPDVKDWTSYHFEMGEDTLLDILVIGDEDVGDFSRNTEYWYVQSSPLAGLGEDRFDVRSTSDDGTPPSLSGDQEFTQPVYPTWQSFTSDPVSGGELYSNDTGDQYLRILVDWDEITRLTWYQTISNQSPTNIAPSGTFSPVGGSVTVPSGQYGYYIDASIN